MLKNVLIAASLALPLAAAAADEMKATEKKVTPQQQKMANCNKEAGQKKLAGDDRKKFMSACLSGNSKKVSQQ